MKRPSTKADRRRSVDQPEDVADDPRYRAGLLTFSLRQLDGLDVQRLWIQERFPRSHCRETVSPLLFRDLRKDGFELADEILWKMCLAGLISEHKANRKVWLFAREVCEVLPPGARLTGLQVLQWVNREISGPELVSKVDGFCVDGFCSESEG